MKKLQLTFNKKYRCGVRIGLGKVYKTEIYQAVDSTREKDVAVKLESCTVDNGTLQKEAKMHLVLKGGIGIPNLQWYGVQHNYRVLVNDQLGPSLEQLLKYCNGRFSLKTVLLIIDQLIDRINWIHAKGIIYNDITPENFLVGLGDKVDKIFVVDFGSCQKYLDGEGNHMKPEKEKIEFKTDGRFRSAHRHIAKRTSRRDDLQSLGYMFVYLLKGELPWDVSDAHSEQDDLQIKEKKVAMPIALLCEQLPGQFIKYFNYAKNLEYEEEPDYSWIKRLFKDLFDSKRFESNRVLDWAQKHTYY